MGLPAQGMNASSDAWILFHRELLSVARRRGDKFALKLQVVSSFLKKISPCNGTCDDKKSFTELESISLDIPADDDKIHLRGLLRQGFVLDGKVTQTIFKPLGLSGRNLVKKVLSFTALCAALMILTCFASAQQKFSLAHTTSTGVAPIHNAIKSAPGAPSYCKPCLLYGGDWNDTSTAWVLFADGNVPEFAGALNVFSPVPVPKGKTWTVTGLFANVGFIAINKMDPATPAWSINKGVKVGSGGTVVKAGTTKGTAKATGRTATSGDGPVVEYTVLVKLPKAVVLKAGNYWENVTPPCTNTSDSACSTALYFESDTFNNATTGRGAHNFGAEPKGSNFQNGTGAGIDWVQLNASYCTSNGFPANSCNWLSAGVIGTSK
jgi:hypothetical protein